VAQFLELFRSDAPVVLVSVMLPEHDKRPGWAGGFTPEFPRPANMSAVQEYSELLNLISMRRAPSSLIVIKQKTEQTNPRIAMRERTGNLIEIEFDACGRNDGVRYLDSVDDTICRVFFAAMTY
jgi:hypothetical protein